MNTIPVLESWSDKLLNTIAVLEQSGGAIGVLQHVPLAGSPDDRLEFLWSLWNKLIPVDMGGIRPTYQKRSEEVAYRASGGSLTSYDLGNNLIYNNCIKTFENISKAIVDAGLQSSRDKDLGLIFPQKLDKDALIYYTFPKFFERPLTLLAVQRLAPSHWLYKSLYENPQVRENLFITEYGPVLILGSCIEDVRTPTKTLRPLPFYEVTSAWQLTRSQRDPQRRKEQEEKAQRENKDRQLREQWERSPEGQIWAIKQQLQQTQAQLALALESSPKSPQS